MEYLATIAQFYLGSGLIIWMGLCVMIALVKPPTNRTRLGRMRFMLWMIPLWGLVIPMLLLKKG